MADAPKRPWWITAACLALLALFVPCARNALAWIDRPFAGFLVLENGLVASMGRNTWIQPERRRMHRTRVVAVAGRPILGGRELQEYVENGGTGNAIRYTFRHGPEMFQLALPVRPFVARDFLEVFLPLLAVGLLVVLGGAVVALRRPDAPEARALFIVCATLGCAMITAPDQYGPYSFSFIHAFAICTIPPATLHLALTYPQRSRALRRWRILYGGLYLPFGGLGVGLLVWVFEPAFFLPLIYTVRFLTANAILLYVGRLVLALIEGVRPRLPVVLALTAALGSSLIVAATLATAPLLKQPISPLLTSGPILLFPILTGIAFLRFPQPSLPDTATAGTIAWRSEQS